MTSLGIGALLMRGGNLSSTMPAVIALFFFVLGWVVLFSLLRSQGWYVLARAFPVAGRKAREQVRMQSLGIGILPLNNAATIGWDDERVYVSVTPLLTLGIIPFFPPFAIPFTAMKSRRRYRQLGRDRDEIEIDAAKRALYDPDLREWPAPKGIRGETGGLRATFEALGMRSLLREEEGELRFEAWKSLRTGGAIVAAVLCAAIYLVLDAWGVSEFRSIVVVILVAWYVPTWLLPTYRLSGKIANGGLQFRLTTRGVLARPARFESALSFYLA